MDDNNMNMGGPNNYNNMYPNHMPQPAHNKVVASFVLGIIAVIFTFFGWGSIFSLILGIVGVVMASQAKKAGNTEGMRTAGFVLSLIGLIGGAIVFIACVACVGFFSALSSSSDFSHDFYDFFDALESL